MKYAHGVRETSGTLAQEFCAILEMAVPTVILIPASDSSFELECAPVAKFTMTQKSAYAVFQVRLRCSSRECCT